MTKFKITLKNIIFGYKSEYIATEEELKSGGLRKILNSGMIENGYELIDICRSK